MKTAPVQLHPRLIDFAPKLVIFDKDGTLIDFQAMWGPWLEALAQRLESATQLSLKPAFFERVGYQPATQYILPDGVFAVAPAAEFQQVIVDFLLARQFSKAATSEIVSAVWSPPDTVALAQPLTNLPALFTALQAMGSKVAVATSDNRDLTEATLSALQVDPLVDGIICADDGLPIKPEPDMILHLCQTLGVPPHKTVMIGDNTVDLQMGRAAQVGWTIGVCSGVCQATELVAYADLVLASIDDLVC